MLGTKRIASTLFSAIIGIGIALAQYSVSGEVVDSTGVGEPYATVRIYTLKDTSQAVKIGVTAENGSFKQELPKAGTYKLSITSVGKREIKREFEVDDENRNANLGRMIAKVADNVLGEVEVVAQKPLVTAEIDRLSYDVENDEDAKTNRYWVGAINDLDEYGVDTVTKYKDIVSALTPEKVAKFVKDVIFAGGNSVKVVMLPEAEKK